MHEKCSKRAKRSFLIQGGIKTLLRGRFCSIMLSGRGSSRNRVVKKNKNIFQLPVIFHLVIGGFLKDSAAFIFLSIL